MEERRKTPCSRSHGRICSLTLLLRALVTTTPSQSSATSRSIYASFDGESSAEFTFNFAKHHKQSSQGQVWPIHLKSLLPLVPLKSFLQESKITSHVGFLDVGSISLEIIRRLKVQAC